MNLLSSFSTALIRTRPFLKRLLVKTGPPVQLIFFVTARCNASCQHCFYWPQLNSSQQELTLEEIEQIAAGLPRLLWLSLTGGEPFLRDDLPAIARVLYAHTHCSILTLPTNGLLTDRIIAGTRKIVELCPQATVVTSISLDGFPETHDAIRQVPGAYNRACETFFELQRLKQRYQNFRLVVTLTLSAYNQQEFSDFYCHVRDKLRPDNIGIGLLRGSPRQPKAAEIDIAFYKKVNAIYRRDMLTGALAYYPPPTGKLLCARELRVRELVAQIYAEKRMLLPCLAGRLSAVILENGEVRPCEVLDRCLGDLRQAGYNFSKVWNSASATAVRASIQAGCYCTYECALSSNVLFNLGQYPALLRILWKLK